MKEEQESQVGRQRWVPLANMLPEATTVGLKTEVATSLSLLMAWIGDCLCKLPFLEKRCVKSGIN